MMEFWLITSLVVLGIIILLFVVFLKKREKEQWRGSDYRSLFMLGVTFFVLGVVLDFSVFYILGVVYLVVGLVNVKKWGKRRILTEREIRARKIVMAVLLVLVILGVAVFILVEEFYIIPSSICGIENCHGLDITCGSNVPVFCTEEYQIGDRCRQYVSCEVIDRECVLVKTQSFVECKSCVEECLEDFADVSKAFECENEC